MGDNALVSFKASGITAVRAALAAIAVTALLLFAGCASVSQVTNLAESACQDSFKDGLISILKSQGETPDNALELERRTERMLRSGAFGPRPFLVSSPSGTDYTFFVDHKGARCLLRLYGRQKGFWSYTNNLTYIETRALPACACSD
jgi:hypothetical protein